MDDSFDTWENAACDGSYTGSGEPYRGANDDSATHRAAYGGDMARRALSITGLDDVDMKSSWHFTPLELAIRGHQPEAVRLLLLAGATARDLYAASPDHTTRMRPVELAAYLGHTNALIALASHGLEIPLDALNRIAQSHSIDCVRTVLELLEQKGLDETQLRAAMGNALEYAASHPHVETVRFLLEAVPGYPDKHNDADTDALT